MAHTDEWNAIPAVRSGRVYALEANSYFSRPGPRLVTGIEALAGVFNPGTPVGEEAQHAALQLAALPLSARAASIALG
jgi:iron complex transport system substrate-binding protein